MHYIQWRDYSYLFAFPLLAIRAFFIGTTQTKILTANSLVMAVGNIGFNYLLIFGKAGFPALGIGGAAIGSSLAGLIGLLFLILYMWQCVDKEQYGLRPVIDWGLSLHLLNISVWTMVRSFFCMAPWFLFFVAIEQIGAYELAAANVVRSISMPFFCHSQFVCYYHYFVSKQSYRSREIDRSDANLPACDNFELYDRPSAYPAGFYFFGGSFEIIYPGYDCGSYCVLSILRNARYLYNFRTC